MIAPVSFAKPALLSASVQIPNAAQAPQMFPGYGGGIPRNPWNPDSWDGRYGWSVPPRPR